MPSTIAWGYPDPDLCNHMASHAYKVLITEHIPDRIKPVMGHILLVLSYPELFAWIIQLLYCPRTDQKANIINKSRELGLLWRQEELMK